MISSIVAGRGALLVIIFISGLATGDRRDVNGVSNDGYTDENRPYKFAFAIEGYQHRMEQKDEKGIIMGEFGFVTGDGVYHETVYATDENGNFRILSMKNYYIGLPGEGTTEPPTTPQTRIAVQTTPKKIELSGIQGCGGCRIPTTNAPDTVNKQPNLYENKINVDERFGNNQRSDMYPDKNQNYPVNPNPPTIARPENKANNPVIKNMIQTPFATPPKSPSIYPVNGVVMEKYAPGIKSELPERKSNINRGDMAPSIDPSGLLYEFNQTQTFQGHREKGYLDNSKEGEYFVNQRDGVKQVVEYIANESGYQPYIKFVNLTASETPDPKTEKIRNMLETMYFKWFYGKG